MSRWSGLAPAVDAHLDRLTTATRSKSLNDRIMGVHARQGPEMNAELLRRMWDDMHLRRWYVFGTSYGLPDADGKPMLAQGVIPRVHDEEGRPLVDEAMSIIDGVDAADNIWNTVEGSTIVGREQFAAEERHLMQGAMLAEREYRMLHGATSHYVSAPVMREVTMAAELATPEPLFHTDLFTPCGFAVFEEPMVVPDLDPETGHSRDDIHIHIRAMGWQRHGGIANLNTRQVHEGVSIFFYTTPEDYQQGYDLPVVDARGAPIGVISQTDVIEDGGAPMAMLLRRKPSGLRVGELMTSPAVTVTDTAPLVEAARLMRDNRIHRLVAVDEQGRTVGVLSASDFVALYADR